MAQDTYRSLRRPRVDDDSDSDTAHQEEARKRARTASENYKYSPEYPSYESVNEDVEEEDDAASDGTSSDGLEEISDEPYQDLDEDVAMRLFTDKMKQQLDRPNQPAECAIIEEVTCTNFMCHEHLTISLGPLINFVTGHNGSGKSAVLTALTLCLGGKAVATNRGQSLKHFIKAGKDWATLSVRIKNQGPSAIKPETYGPSIIVERHFTRAGASNFKIKAANGRTVSVKKSELENITDAFCLQLDNPMNVLTQDMARQFLNNSSASEKYKFFFKGTHLEQLDHDYALLEESNESTKEKLELTEEVKNQRRQEWDDAKKKSKLADKQQGLVDKMNSLREYMAWAQVEEKEQDLATLENKLQEMNNDLQSLEAKVQEASIQVQAKETALSEMRGRTEVIEAAATPLRDEHAHLNDQLTQTQTELIEAQSEQRLIKSYLDSTKKSIASITEKITNERLKLESADNGRHQEKLNEIEEAKRKVEEAEAAEQAHARRFHDFNKAYHDADEEVGRLKPVTQGKERQVREREEMIAQRRASSSDWMARYHPRLPHLLQAIERETRFREKPVGPFGRHIRLLKPEWSSILERSFGISLLNFAVTTKADQAILSELIRKTNYPGNVVIGDSRRLDTSAKEPDRRHLTIMRALEINNDLVRNQLIINQSIDQTVLIKNRAEAVAFLQRGHQPGIRQIFTMHDSHFGQGIRLALTASGETSSPIPAWDKGTRMLVDEEANLEIENATLAGLREELRAAQTALQKAQAAARRAQESHRQWEAGKTPLRVNTQRLHEQYEKLQDELAAETPQGTGIIEALEEELNKGKEDAQMHSRTLENSAEHRERLISQQREMRGRLNSIHNDILAIEERVRRARRDEAVLEQQRIAAVVEKNRAYAALEEAKEGRQQAEEERNEAAQTVGEYIQMASQVCPRVAVPRNETPQSLDAKLAKIGDQLKQATQEMGGSRQELIDRELAVKLAFENAESQHRDLHKVYQMMHNALKNRKDRWFQFRKLVSMRAKWIFMFLLSERQFRGRLTIHHGKRELEIHVEPDITRKSDQGRQTKTLSGGEKSFSTICLLLALWESMGSPIRCLDEFDVFMDNVNRDVSMRMMIQAARRALSRQYVLITPQAMGNVPLGPDVKLHKMRDPERGQTTLPFAAS
ncbi:DNA repair protein Rad18 [Trichodelitschia bisporula]|uniref:DNA repair protein Rad18 n=1 Tax=Trichodelitschia bisporula TaxID=703511 RepID=A0A6G1HV77_9PEZI|nr:DNA repair protein Rad18 [Trichodelitschia bisporula]